MTCTIFENIYATEPNYISVDAALQRIKNGRSRERIEEIRATIDKEKSDLLKRSLPSICFSGKFSKREDQFLIEHSGFLVLDFDNVSEIDVKAAEILGNAFIYALWLSPRGNGLKALIRLADGKKHTEHFAALREIFPEADKSGVNESRVCYESYDPDIYINTEAEIFKKVKAEERVNTKEIVSDEKSIFDKLLKWLSNKGDAFVKGERNAFVYKLAGSCCRYGLNEDAAKSLILSECPASNDFTQKETCRTVQSAYKSNKNLFGTAAFEKDIVVDKITRREIALSDTTLDDSIRPKDVVYVADVKSNAINIYKKGYGSVNGVGIKKLDDLFKPKRGEITCLTGIGNYGKSTFKKWYYLMRILLFGEKFASFAPEDNPPEEYYHDFVEILLGCNCTPSNLEQPSIECYDNAYDFISSHIFYFYPKDLTPTPEYIKESFFELVIKQKIDGVDIDPFNQLAHDYKSSGGRSDKYLETVLGDMARFAQVNNIYFWILAHPKQLIKNKDGNYPCPDVYDLNDGAMWNNKMDNILVYHRPMMQTSPENPLCDFHSKKVRRQKVVGKRGFIELDYNRRKRRFEVDGHDYMADILRDNDLSFNKPIYNYKPPGVKKDNYSNSYAGFENYRSPLPKEKDPIDNVPF